jgi:hypothetical protein
MLYGTSMDEYVVALCSNDPRAASFPILRHHNSEVIRLWAPFWEWRMEDNVWWRVLSSHGGCQFRDTEHNSRYLERCC